MIDAALRRRVGPPLEAAGARLRAAGIRPGWVTGAGLAAGLGACLAAGTRRWDLALGLWLANRALDGLDGPVARAGSRPTERGALLDIAADFSVYGGFVVAVGVAEPQARLACLALLLAYYISGTAFLSLSSLLEKRRAASVMVDERSLRFVGGIAEGAETIVVYALFCLLPADATGIAWGFAAAVGVTAVQRVWIGARLLSGGGQPPRPPRVTIQYLPGCPHVELARSRAAAALQLTGRSDAPVELQEIADPDRAAREPFGGSPTILIDDTDPFPRPPGGAYACRVYQTPNGPEGAPSVEQLCAALGGFELRGRAAPVRAR